MATTDWFAQNAPQTAPAAPPAPAGGGGGDWFAQNSPAAAGASAAPAAAPAAAAPAGGSDAEGLDPTGMADQLKGFAKPWAQAVVGAKDIATKLHVPGTGGPESKPFASMRELANHANDNALQSGGEAVGNTVQFMTGEELLNLVGAGLKGAKAFKAATEITKVLEEHPALAMLVRAGKQALVSGGQTLAKTGGDIGSALTEGGINAAINLATEGTIAGVKGPLARAVAKHATTVEDVGGVPTEIPAEVRNATLSPQQTAGQQSIKNSAQDALARNLKEVNESRDILPPAGTKQLTSRTGPYEFNLQFNPTEREEGQLVHSAAQKQQAAFKDPHFLTGSAPTRTATFAENGRVIAGDEGSMGADVSTRTGVPEAHSDINTTGAYKTEDPNVVIEHIKTINRALEEAAPEERDGLIAARKDAQRQLGEYYEQNRTNYPGYQRANQEQIDIPKAVQKIGSYTEAADHLEKTATDGWQHLNDLTGGQFNAIREENKQAWAAYKAAAGTDAQSAAGTAVDASNRKMDDLLMSINHAVTPKELSGFSDAYKNTQTLRAVATAVDGSFAGNASSTAKSWEQRGFDGTRLMTNLSRLQQRVGRPALERVVGKENLDTLFQVAGLNQTAASKARFGQVIQPVAEWLMQSKGGAALRHLAPIAIGGSIGQATGLGWAWGAIGGEAAALSMKKVMDAVLTNPQVAQNLIFAMKSGANPENYAPLIGGMIQTIANNKPGAAPQSQQPQRGEQ